jgi:hypothetical protein
MSSTSKVLAVADALDFIAENPPGANAGRWVEAVQRVGSGKKGDAWCAGWVSTVLGVAFKGKPPLPFTMSCDALLEAGRAAGWLRAEPEPGDVFLRMKAHRDSDHTGIVTAVRAGEFDTLEGNTTDDKAKDQREGTGTFTKTRVLAPGRYQFIRYPRSA